MKNNMREHIPVFFEGQDDLIDILATSMCSICYNTKSFIDFYILDCGIHEFNKKQLESLKEKFNNFSIKYIPIDLKQFDGLKGWGAGNFLDCYSRLLIPELAPELDRAIYLDTDVIALRDIKLLWDEDLGEYDFGATPDLGYKIEFFKNCVDNLSVSKEHIYASAGMLLIDCKKWREKHVSKKLLNIAKKYKDKIIIINEDILSIAYNNTNYKVLDLRYNMADRANEINLTSGSHITNKYIEKEWNNIILQHFTPSKPWKNSRNDYFIYRNIKNFNNFWFFAKMTPFIDGMLAALLISSNNFNTANTLNIINGAGNHIINKLGNNSLYGNNKITYKLFGFIPLFKVIKKINKKVVKLFNFIPFINIKINN